MPILPFEVALITTPLGVALTEGRLVFVAAREEATGVSVGVAAAVASLVGATVAMGVADSAGVAVPVVVAVPKIVVLTFPRLHASTVRMVAHIPIRILFVCLLFI